MAHYLGIPRSPPGGGLRLGGGGSGCGQWLLLTPNKQSSFVSVFPQVMYPVTRGTKSVCLTSKDLYIF